jgi:putative transposase
MKKKKKKIKAHGKLKRGHINRLTQINKLKKIFINYDLSSDSVFYFLRYYFCMSQINKIFSVIKKRENADTIYPQTFCWYQKDITVKPFWNNQINELSKKIFLPIKKNIKLIGIQNKTNTFDDSWFSNKFYASKNKNNYSYPISENKQKEDTDKLIATRNIKLYLTRDQRYILKRFLGAYRYFYNRTICYINNYNKNDRSSHFFVDITDEKTKIEFSLPRTRTYKNEDGEVKTFYINPFDMKTLRRIFKNHLPTWLEPNFPSHLIDQAINEACNAFSTNMKKYKKTGKPFTLKYKSNKNIKQTMKIDSIYFSKNKNSFFSRYRMDDNLVFEYIYASEDFYVYGQKMCNLSFHKITNEWILHVPIQQKRIVVDQQYKYGAVDPGARKFGTVFSEDHVALLGIDSDKLLYKVCKEIDIIKTRMGRGHYYVKDKEGNLPSYNVNSKRRRNLRKALHRKIKYLKNLKNDLHWKMISYLCKNYKKIIIPPYCIQKMVGALNSKIARKMYNLSYYTFKRRLKETAAIYGVEIIERSEAYTTKTCTNCGQINNNVGNSEIFNCSICGLIIGRDMGAARNIFLKNNVYL